MGVEHFFTLGAVGEVHYMTSTICDVTGHLIVLYTALLSRAKDRCLSTALSVREVLLSVTIKPTT